MLAFKNIVVAVTLFAAPTSAFAQAPSVERAAVVRPEGAPVAREPRPGVPTVATPAPLPVEPKTPDAWFKLAVVATQAINNAVNLGTLAALAFASLCVVYLLMYLGKTALAANLPAEYKKLLRPMLGALTIAATGLGYYLGGPSLAGTAGIGALLSGVSHDVIDSIRSLKK